MARQKPIMNSEDQFAFDTATELIEKVMRRSPEYFKFYVAPWAKKLETECRLRENIFTLMEMGNWCTFNGSVLL